MKESDNELMFEIIHAHARANFQENVFALNAPLFFKKYLFNKSSGNPNLKILDFFVVADDPMKIKVVYSLSEHFEL